MRRHVTSSYGKHVRQAIARLIEAGIPEVVVEVGRGYMLHWMVGDTPMRVSTGKSDRGNAFRSLWATIRAQFRARRLPVPA